MGEVGRERRRKKGGSRGRAGRSWKELRITEEKEATEVRNYAGNASQLQYHIHFSWELLNLYFGILARSFALVAAVKLAANV